MNNKSFITDLSRSEHARLMSVPISAVRLNGGFWGPRAQALRDVTLISQYQQMEETGRIDNLRRAAGERDIPFRGYYFNDSDVYKWLEAAAWTLAYGSFPDLVKLTDQLITIIERAQQPDGYLNSYFMFDKAKGRWANLANLHELYCAGHLIQAAIAHRRATSDDRLFKVAIKLADHICSIFGPEEDGKSLGTSGHPEIEMALVELARETGDDKYLDQAEFFFDIRGHGALGGSEYLLDHMPFRHLECMAGHAVRALYLACGAADIYTETGEGDILAALERLRRRMSAKQAYISGGLGAHHQGESFGKDYQLPNQRAYAETCAAIASMMWNWRMLAISGDAKYADELEKALYNGVLVGMGLDGQSYFYQNPLADDGSHRREPWFKCACCPPNLARLMASLSGYFYGISEEGIWVHLYGQGHAKLTLLDGRSVELAVNTNYPWDGEVEIGIEGEGEFSLMLRIPGWCEQEVGININGKAIDHSHASGQYIVLKRDWKPGDAVRLALPMPVRIVESHPYVDENIGKAAIMRGPILYCLEECDHPQTDLRDLLLPAAPDLSVQFRPDLLDSVVEIRGRVKLSLPGKEWEGYLYRTVHPDRRESGGALVELTAIPYYAWANREAGQMIVWLKRE